MELVHNGQKFAKAFQKNGIALFVFSTFMFSFMGLLVKLANKDHGIPIWEIIFFRSFINFVEVLVYGLAAKKVLIAKNYPLMIFRSVIGFLAFSSYFYAITLTSLADAVILSYTAPVFVPVLSIFFLKKDKLSFGLLVSMFVAMLGAVLVIKPSFDFFNSGGFYGIMAGLLAAIVFMCIRKLSENNGSTTIVLHFTGVSAVLSLPFMLNNFVVPDLKAALYLFLIGTLSMLGQIAMTKGYHYLTAQKGSLISLFNIVISGFLSWFVLKEVLDAYTIAGGILVFISSVGVLLYNPIFFHKHGDGDKINQ